MSLSLIRTRRKRLQELQTFLYSHSEQWGSQAWTILPRDQFLPTRQARDEDKRDPFTPPFQQRSLFTHLLNKYTLLQPKDKTQNKTKFPQKTKLLNSHACLKNTRFTEVALSILHSITAPPKVSISWS